MARPFLLPVRAREWLSGLGLLCAVGCTTPQIAQNAASNPYALAPPSHAHSNYAETTPKPVPEPSSPQNPGQLHLAHGQVLEQSGQFAKARQSYESALKANPILAEAYVGIARLEMEAGRLPEAEKSLKEAIRVQPHSPYALAAMGQFHGDQGKWNEALEYYGQAMAAAPDDKKYVFQMAVALTKSGRVEQAMPLFTRSVGEAAGHYNVAVVLFEQGDLAGAGQHAQLALDREPQLVQAQDLLGRIHNGNGSAVAESTSRPRTETAGLTIRPAQPDAPVGTSRPLVQASATTDQAVANTGLKITPGKAPPAVEHSSLTSNWSPVPTVRPETSDREQWQRMPVAPRNPLPRRAPAREESEWEPCTTQRSSSSFN